MDIRTFFETRLESLGVLDIGLVKLSVFFFALLIAVWWPGILGLNWYWYLILGVVFAIRPIKKVYFSRAY